MQKRYFIQTFGCQANVADSAEIAGVLGNLGFKETSCLEDSDVFVVNTCSVRQKSEDKVYGIAKKLKSLSKKPFVILCGCMVGSACGERKRYTLEALKKKTPWVDLYISPQDISKIPNKIQTSCAYVNISTGCDNFCSYCVVPYSRGKEISRPRKEILEEISNLAKNGISEITLCAQNVNSWGRTSKEGSFVKLLKKIHEIPRITKISFLSSNPFDFTNDLIAVLNLPKLSNYLHIAVQSGSNEILRKMNRKHTVEEFLELVKKIRKVKPDIELGTDIIVGFPSETRSQFLATVELIRKIGFRVVYISMYSPRVGTLAAKKYPDDVPLKEKKYRHSYLTRVWKETL